MPVVNKVLQCLPLHDSRALPYYANSLILLGNKKMLNTCMYMHMCMNQFKSRLQNYGKKSPVTEFLKFYVLAGKCNLSSTMKSDEIQTLI
jgi:hypothetical protein